MEKCNNQSHLVTEKIKHHYGYEDLRAFPYKPPSSKLINEFPQIFDSEYSINQRYIKRFVDIVVSATAIILILPICVLIALGIWIEGLLYPTNSGPLLDPYIAVSRGNKFLKLKFRTLKWCDYSLALRRVDFRFRPSEHDNCNLTYVGQFLKKFYLDEIPQLINIFNGNMSIVGPRPLAWHHYLKTLKQGHPLRRHIKAGLISPMHVRKGEPSFPDMTYDYKYLEMYASLGSISLLFQDFLIILRGIMVVLKGKGL